MFGFSPRAGAPSTFLTTFASRLRYRAGRQTYVSEAAYDAYLAKHPFDESRFVYPFDAIDDDEECIAAHVRDVVLRGRKVSLPALEDYSRHGIALESPAKVHLYEACRYFAATAREDVLATPDERRMNVPDELEQILQLEEWQHPDVANGETPSRLRSFRELATVLETGDVQQYVPIEPPNTHWRNWPEAGTL